MTKLRTFVVNEFKKHTGAKKAKSIEALIFEEAEEHCEENEDWSFQTHIYKQKASLLLDYLACDTQAKKELQEGSITELDLVKLDKRDRANNSEVSNEQDISDGIFQCRKCGSKKTTYYSLQTRSADEPMTNFITCVTCKNRWKM